jgi:hypothetical protein
VRSSDAHFLTDIGAARTSLDLTDASFSSVAAALRSDVAGGPLHA